MPRTLDPVAHALKRDAFLDVAERLIRTRGYDQMSVADVLAELGTSKGAFYHYFDSKEALLEAAIERMTGAGLAVAEPIARDGSLTAAEKLQAIFATMGRWKTERSDLLLALMRSWYSDRNELVRNRVSRAALARIAPLLADVIRQGTAEGSFSVSWPEHAGVILLSLLLGSGDVMGRMVLDHQDGRVSLEEVERFVAAYEEALERVLGLSPGTFVVIDRDVLRVWFA